MKTYKQRAEEYRQECKRLNDLLRDITDLSLERKAIIDKDIDLYDPFTARKNRENLQTTIEGLEAILSMTERDHPANIVAREVLYQIGHQTCW